MPITHIRLRNFKCFQDSGHISLAPLTLIFGRNNTGKSSVLQSLQLLRQTLDSPMHGPRLNLNGSLYPAGRYPDIVHQHRATSRIVFQFTMRLPVKGHLANLELEFCSDEPEPPRLVRLEVSSSLETLSREFDTLIIQRGRGKGGPYELVIGDKTIGGEKKANFRFTVKSFLPLIGDEPPRVGAPNRRHTRSRAIARSILDELEQCLRMARMVGPFRRQPDRRYEYLGHSLESVDLQGESVVHALIEDATRRGRKQQLLGAVNKWLRQLGKVRLLRPRRISKTARLFEIRLKDTDSGRWATNFADVGFGIGQAIPILVEGLRTPPGSMFMAQEPEIHLHPDAQLAMADFLISLATAGRHVIVETHSENLLLRVRHKIAQSSINGRRRGSLRAEQVSLVHVEKHPDGRSTTRQLRMDELGQIENWPKDFMEEATEERIALMETLTQHIESKD